MVNNYAELTLDGVKQGLLFGMIANEEFLRLINDQMSQNTTLQTCNVVYAGAYNFAIVNRKPTPDYAKIVDAVEELYSQEDGMKAIYEMLAIFDESRFGKNLKRVSEDLKKKAEEANPNPKTGQQPEDLHTEHSS